jgi:hypothetical protein
MHQIQLNEELYKEAERRARAAGFDSVDDFVVDRLETDFAANDAGDARDNFDDEFTPELIAHLDQITEEMKAGKSISADELDKNLAEYRKAWLKDHGS